MPKQPVQTEHDDQTDNNSHEEHRSLPPAARARAANGDPIRPLTKPYIGAVKLANHL
jgi:hypothetical protein